MNNVTTTRNGFRVEDITFKNARRQCEIDKELGDNREVREDNVKAPISLTPEQIKNFYNDKISVTTDPNERKVYQQTIRWIDDMLETRKKLIALESKQVSEVRDDENGIEEE